MPPYCHNCKQEYEVITSSWGEKFYLCNCHILKITEYKREKQRPLSDWIHIEGKLE